MCPKGRAQNRNGGKMKKKAAEKVEMKESLLKGEALALNDAELEGAAGGAGDARDIIEERLRRQPETGPAYATLTRFRPGDEMKNHPQSPTWKPITQHPDFDDKDREEIMNEMKRLLDF